MYCFPVRNDFIKLFNLRSNRIDSQILPYAKDYVHLWRDLKYLHVVLSKLPSFVDDKGRIFYLEPRESRFPSFKLRSITHSEYPWFETDFSFILLAPLRLVFSGGNFLSGRSVHNQRSFNPKFVFNY